jgi:hypothetical protein
MSNTQTVSVVIPAYNAEFTLDETLKSVRRQTYDNLEIIVVDDGSSDGTVDVARRHAEIDDRVRIISIENSGVANARNVGIAASRGEFVAPVDADDLWHPEKIARQMEVMRLHGREMGYVYTLFRRLDVNGRVLYSSGVSDFVGHVYLRSLLVNFVGNGSSLLARRAALDEVGGYEPDLLRQGAQGCEDYLIQTLIARSWTVGLVPEYLTGYRRIPGAMSLNWERMARSHLVMLEHVARRVPETPRADLAVAEAAVRARLAVRMARNRQLPGAAKELWRGACLSFSCAIGVTMVELWRAGAMILKHRLPKPRSPAAPEVDFLQCDPTSGRQPFLKRPFGRRLAAMAMREKDFFLNKPLPTVARVTPTAVAAFVATADVFPPGRIRSSK